MILFIKLLEKQSFLERIILWNGTVVDKPVFADDFVADDPTVGYEGADTHTLQDGLCFAIVDIDCTSVLIFLTTKQSHEMQAPHETDDEYFY